MIFSKIFRTPVIMIIFTVAALFLGVLALLHTAYSNIIQQHENPLLYPLTSLIEPKFEEKSLSELIGEKDGGNEKKRLFDISLMVIDESKSLIWAQNEYPKWYKNTITDLKKRISEQEYETYNENINAFNLCKVFLFQSLMNIEGQDINFAVFKLGDEAKQIYPPIGDPPLYVSADTDHILHAIKTINTELVDNKAESTDFKDLFNKILYNYLNTKRGINNSNLITLNVVVISDLLHDVKNKIESELKRRNKFSQEELWKRIKEDKDELKGTINKLKKNKLLVNFIVLKEAKEVSPREKETYIYEELKKCGGYPVKTISIVNCNEYSLLKEIWPERVINFNYTGSGKKADTFFRIKLEEYGGKYLFGLDDFKESQADFCLGDIKYNILDKSGRPQLAENKHDSLEYGKNIPALLSLEANEQIQLNYSGEVPEKSKLHLPAFNIYLPGENQIYYKIPICFKKQLSLGMKWVFFVFSLIGIINIVLVVICPIILGYRGIRFIWNYIRSPKE